MVNDTTKKHRHFFACYSSKGESYIQSEFMGDVLAFTCPIARDNWVYQINKDASNLGKGSVAIKVSSNFARKVLCFEKGDILLFEAIKNDSIFFLSDFGDKPLYITDIDRRI